MLAQVDARSPLPSGVRSRILNRVDKVPARASNPDAGAAGLATRAREGDMVTPTVRLVRALRTGGMGSVWVADHLALKTQVVVKFMASDLVAHPEAVARFAREAAAASRVKSPHVVQMLDHGVMENGLPYLVMELLEGHDLAEHLVERKPLPPHEVVAIVVQLARALVRAHERGVVHRDIKPNNVFLCDAGGGDLFVKLLDFGIAKVTEAPLLGSTTRTGSFVGSPFYMSPEQVIGAKTVDYRTDLWSLGVVAYEALTGQKPFYADTIGGLAIKIHRDRLPRPTDANPALPGAVDAWFERACARSPDERFASAKQMADALVSCLAGARAAYGDERSDRAVVGTASSCGGQSGTWGVIPSAGELPTGGGLASTQSGRVRPSRTLLAVGLGGLALSAILVLLARGRLPVGGPAPVAAALTAVTASTSASASASLPSPPAPVQGLEAAEAPHEERVADAVVSARPTKGGAPAPKATVLSGRTVRSVKSSASGAPSSSAPTKPPPRPEGGEDDIK